MPVLTARLRSCIAVFAAFAALSCGGGEHSVGPKPAKAPAQVLIVSGNTQHGVVGTELSQPLVVKVVDADGQPVAGQVVNFVVTSGGGHVFAGSGSSNASGIVQERWTLGTSTAVEQKLEARAVDNSTGAPIVFGIFTATAVAGPAARVAAVAGDAQTVAVGTAATDSLVAKVTDQYGNPLPGVSVQWAATAGDGSVSPTTTTTDSGGVVRTRLTVGTRPGSNSVTATVAGLAPASFSVMAIAGAPASIVLVDGDAQTGPVGGALATALQVRVVDAHGNPVSGAAVDWSVTGGGGSIAPARATSGTEGLVSATWTLGTLAGPSSARATLQGVGQVAFTATAVAGPVASLQRVAGDGQAVLVPGTLPESLAVRALDAYANPVSGASIAWSTSSGGSFSPSASSTNAAGIARTQWSIVRSGANDATATAPSGRSTSFVATGQAGTSGSGLRIVSGDGQRDVVQETLQPLVVEVVDSFGSPVPNVRLRWTVDSGGTTSLTFQGTTITDGYGRAHGTLRLPVQPATIKVTATTDSYGAVVFTEVATAGPWCSTSLTLVGPNVAPAGGTVHVDLHSVDAIGNPAAGGTLSRGPTASDGGTVTFVPDSVVPGLQHGSWKLGGTVGTQTLTYSTYYCGGLSPKLGFPRASNGTETLSATATTTAVAASLAVVSGAGQTSEVKRALPDSVVVRAVDSNGNGVRDVTVLWTPSSDGGAFPAQTVTDSAGYARTQWGLGSRAGTQTLSVSTSTLGPVTITATATPGPVERVTLVGGNWQGALPGQPLPRPLLVRTTDYWGNPVSGVPVAFEVHAGGGQITPATATSDASGTASAVFTMGPATGDNTATAVAVGLSSSITATATLGFASVVTGSSHGCGLTPQGEAWCWGRNNGGAGYTWGALGNGTLDPRASKPTRVVGGLTFRALAAGNDFTCGIATDDLAYCWGNNGNGVLGTGSFEGTNRPVPVAGNHHFTSIAASALSVCAIGNDTLTYCWGADDVGNLGYAASESCRGTATVCSTTPQPVQTQLRFTQVAPGVRTTCALTSDGTGYCWGSNANGALGAGDVAGGPTPVPLATSLTFKAIASSCALTFDGRAYCWGPGLKGALGNGTTSDSYQPVPVAGGHVFEVISGTCAASRDEGTFCWGRNDYNALGVSGIAYSATPLRVGDFVTVSQGTAFGSTALSAGGVAYAWGGYINDFGPGDAAPSVVPGPNP